MFSPFDQTTKTLCQTNDFQDLKDNSFCKKTKSLFINIVRPGDAKALQ